MLPNCTVRNVDQTLTHALRYVQPYSRVWWLDVQMCESLYLRYSSGRSAARSNNIALRPAIPTPWWHRRQAWSSPSFSPICRTA
jgi:hypothetical protein